VASLPSLLPLLPLPQTYGEKEKEKEKRGEKA